MGIVEAGHYKFSVQFDDLGVRPLQLKNFYIFTDGLNPVAANRNRLGALDRIERGLVHNAGVNVAVEKDSVGAGGRSRLLRSNCACKKERQQDNPYIHWPTPASTSKVRRILFSPSSLPEQSNHSC